ncbi:MAG: hypothetical protein NC342_02335 [Pseudoflavonifractor sp.]|nr:hypothetical protein [Alloprevotella sp.]MCM1116360.1 hypothetical protein [Pseudoflavonifractor sp.]
MFDADTPLSMEWSEVAPEDVVEGSTATLRLISPGDRTFTDLYAIDPLSIVLEVKTGNDVVWRGSIEPELYEEPYSTKDGYVVELSFSDLGPMESREFNLSGRVTFDQIIAEALSATALNRYSLKCSTTHLNTSTGIQEPLDFSNLYISADNFYDEDGKAKTPIPASRKNRKNCTFRFYKLYFSFFRQYPATARTNWHSNSERA